MLLLVEATEGRDGAQVEDEDKETNTNTSRKRSAFGRPNKTERCSLDVQAEHERVGRESDKRRSKKGKEREWEDEERTRFNRPALPATRTKDPLSKRRDENGKNKHERKGTAFGCNPSVFL